MDVQGILTTWSPLFVALGVGLHWLWTKFEMSSYLSTFIQYRHVVDEDKREYEQTVGAKQLEVALELDQKKVQADITQRAFERDIILTLLAEQIEFTNSLLTTLLNGQLSEILEIAKVQRDGLKSILGEIDIINRNLGNQ